MTGLTVIYALLFYAVAGVLVFVTAMKVWDYARTLALLEIPMPPVSVTRGGVAFREAVPLKSGKRYSICPA